MTDILIFNNPILTGFNPDPSIVRVGSDYFLTTSTFEYFPGLPIYHSKDLLNWELIGHALTRRSQLDLRTVEPGGGIWAPTLRWRADKGGTNGRFYLTTCSWSRYRPQLNERIFPRGFYVYTDDIWDEKAWSEPIFFDDAGYDQDLFWDDDGKVYLSTTNRLANRPPNSTQKDFAIHISGIDLESGRSLTPTQVIRTSPGGIAEGSHIIKRGSWYYLFVAEGGTESGHHEVVLRSNVGPLGPWLPGPELWYNGKDDIVQNTGHADVFEDHEGEWWAVLLGVRCRLSNGEWKDSQLGRETLLVKVDWVDDWPIFNFGSKISLQTKGKKGAIQIDKPLKWVADFTRKELELGWYTKHTPLKSFYKIDAVLHTILLYGGCYDLQSPECPSMLLRKQTGFTETFSVELQFEQNQIGAEAGIVVWYGNVSFASIGIRRSPDGSGTELVKRIRDKRSPDDGKPSFSESTLSLAFQNKTALSIQADTNSYKLSSESDPSSFLELDVETVLQPPPLGGMFTGMMFGIYSFGKGGPCLEPAVFSNVTIQRH